MSAPKLTVAEQAALLKLARLAVESAASHRPMPRPDAVELTPSLIKPGACFVTLFENGELRGCTGVLQARQPLVEEVIQTAAQTASFDPRFAPVAPHELTSIQVEVSALTPPQKLSFSSPDDLLAKIRPGVDGVTLYRGELRATFLPQVWLKLPDPAEFLSHLCQKMGLPPHAWRQPGMTAEVYQVQEFAEGGSRGE